MNQAFKKALFNKKNALIVLIGLTGLVLTKLWFGVSLTMELTVLGLLLIPVLFAVATLADKILVHGDDDDSDPGAIQALGGAFSIVFMVPMGLWVFFAGKSLGDWNTFILIVFIEAAQIVSMFLYMHAVKGDAPSRVAPWWQIIPIYGAITAIVVLDEIPTSLEWFGIAAVVVGGFIVSKKKGSFNRKTFMLMGTATILIAVYEVYFAEFGRGIDEISALFISLIGKAFWGLTFLVFKKYRTGFILALRTKLRFQTVTEISCTAADLGLLYFFLVFPVALVQAICCLQPMFVLGGALFLNRFFPEAMKDEFEGRASLKQRMIGMAILVVGGVILSFTLET